MEMNSIIDSIGTRGIYMVLGIAGGALLGQIFLPKPQSLTRTEVIYRSVETNVADASIQTQVQSQVTTVEHITHTSDGGSTEDVVITDNSHSNVSSQTHITDTHVIDNHMTQVVQMNNPKLNSIEVLLKPHLLTYPDLYEVVYSRELIGDFGVTFGVTRDPWILLGLSYRW